MKVVKNWNDISEKLKEEIPPLLPGQTATFQMLGGRPNPDEEERKKIPMLYGKQQLLTQFRVFDKYKKDSSGKEKGGYVDIVLAEDWIDDKPTKSRMFVAGHGEGFFGGKFDLMGGKIEDEELYEVLMLSPEREGTPCPDASVKPKFKILDFKKEAQEKTRDLTKFKKAVDLAINISDADAEKVLRSINRTYTNPDELRAAIGDLARTNPDLFLKVYDDPNRDTKAILKEAIDAGVIAFDAKGKITMGDEIITTIKTKDGVELLEQLASWVNSAQNGKDVFASIKKQLEPVAA